MYSGTSDLLLFTGNSYITTYNDRRPFIIPNSVIQTVLMEAVILYTQRIQHRSMNCIMILTGILLQTWLNLTTDRIIDRSFLKLRDISLSYNFPKKWASKISATNLNLAVYGRNLLLWTPESNIYIDPEASNLGNDLTSQLGEFRTSPTSMQFGVQLRATF